MSNVVKLSEKSAGWSGQSRTSSTSGGNPPGGIELERRVQELEKVIPEIRERLVRVETKIDSIERSMATKPDLEALHGRMATEIHKAIGEQTWKFLGVSAALAGIAFTAARFIGT